MSIRNITLTALVSLSTLVGGLLLTGAPALGKELYLHDYSFGPEGPNAGAFTTDIESVALDRASGDVYVYDASAGEGAGAIYKFNASGEPAEFTSTHTNVIEGVGPGFRTVSFSELAVDSSAGATHGDIYLASGGKHFGIYAADGSSLGELNEGVTQEFPGSVWERPCGVTVDAAGHVYVGMAQNANEYTPAANPVRNSDYTSRLEGFYGLCNLAVDGEGHVYAQAYYGAVTRRYPASQFGTGSTSVGPSIDGAGTALAVDPSNNDVFVDEGSHVAQFDSSGTLIRRFATLGSASFGVASSVSSHEVYVANNTTGQIDAFHLVDVSPPAVNDQAAVASAVTRTSVALSGTVNPEGYDTHYKFVYGPSAHYLHSTPELDGGEAATDQTVGPVGIEGLLPGVTYHYAIVATNMAGTSRGPDQTFTTAGATAPLVVTGAAGAVTQTAVLLEGSVDTRALVGTYGFELGTSAGQYGPRIGLGLIVAGGSPVQATLGLSALEPATTYYYRVTATNSDGTSYGAEQSFTTTALTGATVSTPPSLGFLTTPKVVFPSPGSPAPNAQSNAQRLAKALKACKKKAKSKRGACERQARKKYPTARRKATKK